MLNYLMQFTSGEPHRIVCGFSHLNAKSGYEATWSEFCERYGDSDVIANAYVKRAINWPTIKPENPKALDDFSIFLRECQYAVDNVEASRVLEYSENLKHLVFKLPFYMHEKWRNIVYELKDKNQHVTFSHLVQFVRKEARKANDPVYGKDVLGAINRRTDIKPNPSAARGLRKNFSISVNESDQKSTANVNNAYKVSVAKTPCLFCNGRNHTLDVCRTIMKKDLKDRYQFLKTKGLCFSCLKAGHQKGNCQNKTTCSHCSKTHPSILHVEPRGRFIDPQVIEEHQNVQMPVKAISTATNAHTGAGVSTCLGQALPIVPVRLKSINSDKYVETYAFLDGGSTSSFCTDAILEQLNVEGKKTKINLLTMGQEKVVDTSVASGLEICDLNGQNAICLPPIFTRPSLPIARKDIVSTKDLAKWPHLQDVPLNRIDADVGLLIGINIPRAMEPYDMIASVNDSPFAVKTLLGWVVNGPLNVECANQSTNMFTSSTCNRIQASVFLCLDDQLRHFFNHDFSEKAIDDKQEHSKLDTQFLDIASKSIKLENGHYEMDLPFRSENVEMPNNRKQAEQRLVSLSKRFKSDSDFKDQYSLFMDKIIAEGHATIVKESDLSLKNGKIWYLPHNGVYHPKKHKLRVVFDCAARYGGTSLNEKLLQGPNLTNSLIGTLIRFRQDEIAMMGDIDGMFHQVRVSEKDTDFLRFLWWENGDCSTIPIEYKMTVHLFGATSSPSCANYALRQTAMSCKGRYNDDVIDTVLRNFYVDDCLKSVACENDAIQLINDIQALLSEGGFRIAKWISNNRNVIRSVPLEARAKEVMDLDLHKDDLPIDRALGTEWHVDTDKFGFKVDKKDKPVTRRGILSLVSSVFDPLGFLAPFTFIGKHILQDLCKTLIGWDDRIPDIMAQKWKNWLNDLEKLSAFQVSRCLKPSEFGSVTLGELHHFADASEIGYGTVTYLRMENESGMVHCSFLLGKSRVAPLKQVTVPRLELTAATIAVKTNKMILSELEIPIQQSYFWTDSMSVIRYIRNSTSRFHTFVANRLNVIHEGSNVSDWFYINTKLNPADIASRGISADSLIKKNCWISPPEFLWKPKTCWPISYFEDVRDSHDDYDLEVKQVSVRATVTSDDSNSFLEKLVNAHSSWYSLKRCVVWILRVKKQLLRQIRSKINSDNKQKSVNTKLDQITVAEMNEAEIAILSIVQRQSYADEIKSLQEGRNVKKKSPIHTLDPELDSNGLIRIGGRLQQSSLNFNSKHKIILPKGHSVSTLILRHIHEVVGHSGRNHMLAHLRQRFWIVNAPSAIRNLIAKCVTCRRLNSKVGEQKMAELPEDRLVPNEPPFTRVGEDYFGPFEVKVKRSHVKRYGVIFTCLASRAIHIEVAYSLDTDSYINALRRFISRRGQVQKIR